MAEVDRDTRSSGRQSDPKVRELRSEFERDNDSLLYTYYFRRLAEITQVSSMSRARPDGSADSLQHNRLTHSLKVSQVARRLVAYLSAEITNQAGIDAAGGLDADVAGLAGMAHDIGHPPFGHVGEDVLDEICRAHDLIDGFEGNAQTFRVLATLIRRVSQTAGPIEGLDLTSASLAACVKYPWPRGAEGKRFRKFGYIDIDEPIFTKMVKPRLYLPDESLGTLEAQVMDWADDVSYASHDIEDFVLAGAIPIHLLAHYIDEHGELRALYPHEFDRFWDYASAKLSSIGKVPHADARRQFQNFATSFQRSAYNGTRESAGPVGALSSKLITLAGNPENISVTEDGVLDPRPDFRSLIEVLKQLTWYYVIDRPQLVAAQRGQRKRLKAVAEEFITWAGEVYSDERAMPWGKMEKLSPNAVEANKGSLPPLLREMIDDLLSRNKRHGAYSDAPRKNIVRGVVDFIASLRETDVDYYYELMLG